MVIGGSRSFLAALLLLSLRLFAPARGKAKIDKTAVIKSIFKNAPVLALCGLCYTATMLLFVAANKLTASANAIMLQYTAPVWAAIFSWIFLKERPRWEQWGAMAMAGFGLYMVFSGGFIVGSMTGDILALISGITFGANSIVLRANKDGNPADIMLFAHIICVIFTIPFFFLHPPSLTARNILCISYMGIFQLGMASALFAYGIKRITAVQAMLTAAIEPVLNPVWVLLAIGERPVFSVVVGGGIIIIAVVISSLISELRRRRTLIAAAVH